MRILKASVISLAIIFILIQLYPNPLPKNSDMVNDDFLTDTSISKIDAGIIKNSCYDCHSNYTHYPWYSKIAPFSWLIANHIREGRKKLNFSEWMSYTKKHQIRKLEDIQDEINNGEMPLKSYLLIHRSAKLTKEQKEQILKFCDRYSEKIIDSAN